MHNTPDTSTRRDFLGKSAAATAAGSLVLPASLSAQVEGNSTLKLGLVGCGGRGSGAANQNLTTQGTKLVAMGDVFRERMDNTFDMLTKRHKDAVEVPEENKFIGFDSYLKVIEMSDVVILATPPGFRPMMFEAAVEAGKHVFMEKPVCVDAAGYRRVMAAAKKADEKGLKVVVGLQRHYQKSYLETLKRVKDGMIGDIVSAQVWWNGGGVWVRDRQKDDTEMRYQCRNWYYFNWLCGDNICEQHIHNIDVANWFIGGYPTQAQGMGGRQVRNGKDHGEIFDHHFVEFTYDSGAVIASQCRHQQGCMRRVDETLQGSQGSVNMRKGLLRDLNGNDMYQYKSDPLNEPNPYQVEHDQLFDSIRNGGVIADAENGAKSTLTAIMGRMATYSGKVITWEQAMNSNLQMMPESLDWNSKPPTMPDSNGNYAIPTPGITEF